MMRRVRTAVVGLGVSAALAAALVFGAYAGLRLVSGDWMPQPPEPTPCVDAVDILVATVHDYPDQVEAAANYLVLNCPELADPTGIRDL